MKKTTISIYGPKAKDTPGYFIANFAMTDWGLETTTTFAKDIKELILKHYWNYNLEIKVRAEEEVDV